MSVPKPQPRELIVQQLDPYSVLKITTGSTDAVAWVEREAPQFGALCVPTPMTPYYLLAVTDIWDTEEVLTYLLSYNNRGQP